MAAKHTRLELTWIGKDERPRLEPRILLEDQALSYHSGKRVSQEDIFDNILIHGDNLLALKALEQDFAAKIKCVYIDPPFNTGQAFEHYDDGIEHSIWLSLMRNRIECLHKLLAEDGTIVVHIDENELAYLTVVLDEVFGRPNRASLVTFKQSSVSGPKAINPGLVTIANYILIYAKNKTSWRPNRVFVSTGRDDRYNNYLMNPDESFHKWHFATLRSVLAEREGCTERQLRSRFGDGLEDALEALVLEDPGRVVRLARVQDRDVNETARIALQESRRNRQQVQRSERDDRSDYYFLDGQQLLFYSSKAKQIDGKWTTAIPASNIWDDLLSNNLHNEGGVSFPKGKKPEALLQRIIELTSNTGDWVLDSFAGSGTTGATAHKLYRRWIMVELGDQCLSHVVPRLKNVVDGLDTSGITAGTGWSGGGGFRFYNLAPSLLETDKWGNWVVSKQYNPEMLAEAMCKLEGFRYAPDPDTFWIHGQSTETDLIYVTTQNLSQEQLQFISDQVGDERTLLICCSAFRANPDAFANLTLKKIPQAVLHRCEWGRDDYSLNVNALPDPEPEPDQSHEESAESMAAAEDTAEAATPRPATRRGRPRRRSASMQELPLFATLDQGGDA
jgi:adenine-specific DNA-methyltransferase